MGHVEFSFSVVVFSQNILSLYPNEGNYVKTLLS